MTDPEAMAGLVDVAEEMRRAILGMIEELSWIMRPSERTRLQTIADGLGKAITRVKAGKTA